MGAKLDDYSREQEISDLNPHKAALFAMWHWSLSYAESGLGSMGFWNSLGEHHKKLCRAAVAEICSACDEPSQDIPA